MTTRRTEKKKSKFRPGKLYLATKPFTAIHMSGHDRYVDPNVTANWSNLFGNIKEGDIIFLIDELETEKTMHDGKELSVGYFSFLFGSKIYAYFYRINGKIMGSDVIKEIEISK